MSFCVMIIMHIINQVLVSDSLSLMCLIIMNIYEYVIPNINFINRIHKLPKNRINKLPENRSYFYIYLG